MQLRGKTSARAGEAPTTIARRRTTPAAPAALLAALLAAVAFAAGSAAAEDAPPPAPEPWTPDDAADRSELAAAVTELTESVEALASWTESVEALAPEPLNIEDLVEPVTPEEVDEWLETVSIPMEPVSVPIPMEPAPIHISLDPATETVVLCINFPSGSLDDGCKCGAVARACPSLALGSLGTLLPPDDRAALASYCAAARECCEEEEGGDAAVANADFDACVEGEGARFPDIEALAPGLVPALPPDAFPFEPLPLPMCCDPEEGPGGCPDEDGSFDRCWDEGGYCCGDGNWYAYEPDWSGSCWDRGLQDSWPCDVLPDPFDVWDHGDSDHDLDHGDHFDYNQDSWPVPPEEKPFDSYPDDHDHFDYNQDDHEEIYYHPVADGPVPENCIEVILETVILGGNNGVLLFDEAACCANHTDHPYCILNSCHDMDTGEILRDCDCGVMVDLVSDPFFRGDEPFVLEITSYVDVCCVPGETPYEEAEACATGRGVGLPAACADDPTAEVCACAASHLEEGYFDYDCDCGVALDLLADDPKWAPALGTADAAALESCCVRGETSIYDATECVSNGQDCGTILSDAVYDDLYMERMEACCTPGNTTVGEALDCIAGPQPLLCWTYDHSYGYGYSAPFGFSAPDIYGDVSPSNEDDEYVCISFCWDCALSSPGDGLCTSEQILAGEKISQNAGLPREFLDLYDSMYAGHGFAYCETDDCNRADACTGAIMSEWSPFDDVYDGEDWMPTMEGAIGVDQGGQSIPVDEEYASFNGEEGGTEPASTAGEASSAGEDGMPTDEGAIGVDQGETPIEPVANEDPAANGDGQEIVPDEGGGAVAPSPPPTKAPVSPPAAADDPLVSLGDDDPEDLGVLGNGAIAVGLNIVTAAAAVFGIIAF